MTACRWSSSAASSCCAGTARASGAPADRRGGGRARGPGRRRGERRAGDPRTGRRDAGAGADRRRRPGTSSNELLDGAGRAAPEPADRGSHARLHHRCTTQATGQEYRFVPEGPAWSRRRNGRRCSPRWSRSRRLGGRQRQPAARSPDDFSDQAPRIAARRGQSFVLDSSGSPLKAALGQGITLLKLSLNELHHLLGRPLADPRAQADKAMALVGRVRRRGHGGADPGRGGRAAGQRRRARCTGWQRCRGPCAGRAGDAFLAAMTLALARGKAPERALAWGIAAGTAAVAGVGTARLTRAQVEALVPDGGAGEGRRLGLRPRPHQGALPLGTPPRAEPLEPFTGSG